MVYNPKCRKKISNLAEKKFVLAGGGTLTCQILTGEGYGADISYQGTKVLTYLRAAYGWGIKCYDMDNILYLKYVLIW